MTLHVDLDADQQELVERLVAEGIYKNASDAIADGLRLIEAEHAEEAADLEALREAAREGFADFETGNFLTVASEDDHQAVWAEIHQQVAARRAARQATAS